MANRPNCFPRNDASANAASAKPTFVLSIRSDRLQAAHPNDFPRLKAARVNGTDILQAGHFPLADDAT